MKMAGTMDEPTDQERTGERDRPLRVGRWRVEPLGLRLVGPGGEDGGEAEVRRLEPRVMALLVCLARRAGRPVTREELLEEVWSDVVVGDDAIHSAVSKLRSALANGEGERGAIETVPKVGYRLVTPVAPAEEDGGPIPAPATDEAPDPVTAGPTGERAGRPAGRGGVLRWVLERSGWAVPVLLLAVALGSWAVRSSGDRSAGPGPARAPEIRPVTSWPGLEVEPAFAPGETGDRIAFSWKGPEGENWDVWLQVLGAGDPLRLTTHPGSDHYPAWSPDGRHLAFVRYGDGGCSVRRIPALGGAERRLAGCVHAEGLAWAPDGRHLLWAERPAPEKPFRIVELDLGTGRQREVTEPPPGSVGDLGPEVSPDGSTLAFLRSPVLGVEDLYLLPRDGGTLRRLTHDDLKIHGAGWAPDGRSLVFSSNRGGLFSLWRIGVDGGEPRWLGASGGDLDAPSVAGDGRRIGYEQWTDETNVYRLALTDGTPAGEPRAAAEPVRVLGSTRWDWGAEIAPGGDRVVFVSDRSGASELWVAPTGGGPDRRLTELGGPYVDAPRWSPGGDRIVFEARPGGNADVYLVGAAGGGLLRLTSDPAQDVAPAWSRDGRWVYFASDRGGRWEVWKVGAPDGDGDEVGPPVRVTRGGGYLAQESADGRWLYHSRRHEAGLWRQPLAPGPDPAEPERVVDDLVPLDRTRWRLAGDGLYYLRRPRHDRPVLTRLDPATGESAEIAELGALPWNSGLSVTPDERTVLFSRCDRWESDILVLETSS